MPTHKYTPGLAVPEASMFPSHRSLPSPSLHTSGTAHYLPRAEASRSQLQKFLNNLAISAAHGSQEWNQRSQSTVVRTHRSNQSGWVHTVTEVRRRRGGHLEAGANMGAGSEAPSSSMSPRVGKIPKRWNKPCVKKKNSPRQLGECEDGSGRD